MHVWDPSQWDKMCFEYQYSNFNAKNGSNFSHLLADPPPSCSQRDPKISFVSFDDFPKFFTDHVFVGVFQYHLRPPKRWLELRNWRTIKNLCFSTVCWSFGDHLVTTCSVFFNCNISPSYLPLVCCSSHEHTISALGQVIIDLVNISEWFFSFVQKFVNINMNYDYVYHSQ